MTRAAFNFLRSARPRAYGLFSIIPLPYPKAFCSVNMLEIAGGAAAGDLDGDGWDDLYVTRVGAPDHLFGNKDDGTFEDMAEQAGLSEFLLHSNGVAIGDIDNDGDLDIFLTTVGQEGESIINTRYYLFINNEFGVFREAALERGAALNISRAHIGYSATFGDYDLDGEFRVSLSQSTTAKSCPGSTIIFSRHD